MIIYALVVSGDLKVSMLYGTGRDDDEPNVIYQGTLDESGIQLTRAFEMHDVQSLCALPAHFDAAFLAVDGDGRLLWLGETYASDQIAGAGYHGKTARRLGRMSRLQTTAGSVFALGYGGQAYQCDSREGGWTYCAEGLAALVAEEDKISVSSVMIHPESQALYVGGTVVGGTLPHAEAAIDAANEAHDAEALAELLLANVKRDRGGLWRHTGQWEEVPLPTDNPLLELFALPGATVILGSEAEMLSARHGEPFRRDERPDGYLEGFCRYEDRVLLSFSGSLFTFDGDALAPFAASPFAGRFHDLIETPIGLLAASRKRVSLFVGGTWRALKVKGTRAPRIAMP